MCRLSVGSAPFRTDKLHSRRGCAVGDNLVEVERVEEQDVAKSA